MNKYSLAEDSVLVLKEILEVSILKSAHNIREVDYSCSLISKV